MTSPSQGIFLNGFEPAEYGRKGQGAQPEALQQMLTTPPKFCRQSREVKARARGADGGGASLGVELRCLKR